jgi:prolyl oligopeptidase
MGVNWKGLLRKTRKTVATPMEPRTTPPTGCALGPPPEDPASSFAAWWRASAPFALFGSVLIIGVGCILLAAGKTLEQPDKYQWLEDVTSPRALAWVNNQNQRTAKVLKNDPHYAAFEADALKLLQAPDRLPTPELKGNLVYNFWQDDAHVQGIFRVTSLVDYLNPQPHWETVLDVDALSERENKRWVWKGIDCLYPGDEFCLVNLSAGGEDAKTVREFNLKTCKFVGGGFILPRGKQEVAWIDKDTLLVSRDWGGGTLTSSGYPFVVKLWKRGQPLREAKEVYRGEPADEIASPTVLHDGDGHEIAMIVRYVNFFQSQVFVLTNEGVKQVGLPPKIDLAGMVKDQIIVSVNQAWNAPTGGGKITQGSIIALSRNSILRDAARPEIRVLFAPTSVEFAQNAQVTKNHLLVTTLDNVQGRAYAYSLGRNGTWKRERLNFPDKQTISIANTNLVNDQFFTEMTGFLMPPSLSLGDAGMDSNPKLLKSQRVQFDASRDVVEQLWAFSRDGTKVPYFIVRPKDMKLDGNNPTALEAYGGFQVSNTPTYSAVKGKLWLERGGVYVVANIRGGGEFGPAWHEAGLKTHRQRIYDDFAAVAQDLVSRRITSSRRLGIIGGSNGGLLMGVEMTQHPGMWHAVAIMVPLLDMLRFEKIAAGSSWVAEYGSVSVPTERQFLASISPYNQLRPDVNYPEPYIYTTTKDDRVGPVHARKFAARMEEFGKPFFYQEITEGGHGPGANLRQEAASNAMLWTYFNKKLMR